MSVFSWGEVEILDRSGQLLFSGRNRITKSGLLAIGKVLSQDGTVISKLRVGTGTTPPTVGDNNLEAPIEIDFPIINKTLVQSQDGNSIEVRFTSMVESQDENLSFYFSEAGLFATFTRDDGTTSDILVARIVFPPKYKRPFNEYYLTWKIKLSLG